MNENEAYLKEINRLKSLYNDILSKIENEELPCYFAQDLVEDLLRTELRLKKFLRYIRFNVDTLEELDFLINQTKQLSHDITDIIYIERKQCF